MLFWSSDEFLFRKNLCKPISSADSSRNSTHRSFYEVKINVSVSSVEMLVISPNFNISFEFAVKMRKIGTLLYYGGSGRHFEAIVCWSLFFVANACLCGSNFPQIGWLRKWEDFSGLACLKNHIQVVFFIKTIWLQTCMMFEGENRIWLYEALFTSIIESQMWRTTWKNRGASKRLKWKRLKTPQSARKRLKALESTLKRLKALLSFPGRIWSRLLPQCTYLAKCFNLSLQRHFSRSNIEPSFVKPTNVIFGAHYLHQSSFNFKLLQYCLTYVPLDFVGDTVSLTQQVSKIAHVLPSPFWPQVNDHFSLRSFMSGICMWFVIDWKIDVLLYAKFSIYWNRYFWKEPLR